MPEREEISPAVRDISFRRTHVTPGFVHIYPWSVPHEVRDDLEIVAGTADTIGKKEPGFATPYRLGDDTQRQILADAKRVLKELEPPATVAKFIAYAMDENFITHLKTDLALIDDKGEEQEEDQIDAVGDTAHIRDLIKEARALIKSLNTSVKNKFRRDPEILAEWHTASHIQRTPRGPQPGDTPEPPPAG